MKSNKKKKAERRDGFEPRRYTQADEDFAKRLRQGFRMLRGRA